MKDGSIFLVEPRDPLIARDGRPAGLGGSFSTLGFPPPSVIAGAARTRMALKDGVFNLSDAEIDLLLKIAVHGPLLTELGTGDQPTSWFAPAPRDAVLFSCADSTTKGAAEVRRLQPISLPPGAAVGNLGDLSLVGAADPQPSGKPYSPAPPFWRWDRFAEWLGAPCAPGADRLGDRTVIDVADLGLPALLVERRTHLAIEAGERVGIDGQLFQTAGLRFLAVERGAEPRHLAPRRLALALRTEGGQVSDRVLKLQKEELAPLGGERRLARWRSTEHPWPELPPEARKEIVATRRARMVLATPAHFLAGSLPGWQGKEIPGAPGVIVKIRAARVDRPEVVSGWDLRAKNVAPKPRGRAKPSRRLAPAGSVYWVDLDGEDIGAWCDRLWFQPVSDDEQSRRDGFGLVALGTWPQQENPR